MRRPKLAYIVTVPTTARVLLRGQLAFMREAGFDVTVIASPGAELEVVAQREGVRVLGIEMPREINVVRDAKALLELSKALGAWAPDIVNASTPKAGLLGMLSAWRCQVPIRVYLLRGLRFELSHGVKGSILRHCERVAAHAAHRIVCVSGSVKEGFLKEGLARAEKCHVLGAGSSNGVDLERFDPERVRGAAEELARTLKIQAGEQIFGFVGRPVADKGSKELMAAWEGIRAKPASARLLIVGAGFAGDDLDPELQRWMAERDDIIAVGEVEDLAPYFALMHALVFPSYREGFPNVPLEAAAMGVPTVGFRATGTRDVVLDGTTGLLANVGDADGLQLHLERYLKEPELCHTHGQNAQRRARELFDRRRIWELWLNEYQSLLSAAGLPLPTALSSVRRAAG